MKYLFYSVFFLMTISCISQKNIDTTYWKSGGVKAILKKDDNGKVIEKSEFYENGNKSTYSQYNNSGLLDGGQYKWFEDGGIASFEFYFEGKASGPILNYNKKGIITLMVSSDSIGVYENEVYIEGVGEAIEKMTIFNGLNTYFHENGKIKEQGKYAANHKVGKWYEWDSNGKLTKLTIYEDNLIEEKKIVEIKYD